MHAPDHLDAILKVPLTNKDLNRLKKRASQAKLKPAQWARVVLLETLDRAAAADTVLD